MRRFQVGRLVCVTVYLCLVAGIVPGLQGETKRALLIGINHYAPPAGAALPVTAAEHALDSRFAPGSSWTDLHGPSVDVASVHVLLTEKYGFDEANITVLPEKTATREGILAAIDMLIADTKPGDLIVFYYAGHGSQRLDTMRVDERTSKNKRDETIVPNDAWKGARDIRDIELAVRFDKIVYDKQARLTAIFDSCHSGTMARGVTSSVQRTLPYDDRDVAKEPGAATEGDLKQVPQKGNAIIVAAAGPSEGAAEVKIS